MRQKELYSRLEYVQEGEHESMSWPENEDQERSLAQEIDGLDMAYGDASERDWHENTYPNAFNIPILCL